jgi:predicted amidohydrolase
MFSTKLSVSLIGIGDSIMANYVKLSAVGPAALIDPRPPHGQEAVDRMIEYWRGELRHVLVDRPDLAVVPEACDRYICHTTEERNAYCEIRGNQVRDAFAEIAKEHHCHVAYSAAREVRSGVWANSTQIIGRDGQILGAYDKNHPTIPEMEEHGVVPGTEAPLVRCDFGTVASAICFDLNFDELRLAYATARPDLIVFSSMYHGGLMQNYWAYSCRAHFIGAVAGLPCAVISPVGEVMAHSTNYYHYVTATVNLDCRVVHLDCNRERLVEMRDKYGARVSVHDPGLLGSVLVTSETDELTADDLVREFELEPLDDYFERSRAARRRGRVGGAPGSEDS